MLADPPVAVVAAVVCGLFANASRAADAVPAQVVIGDGGDGRLATIAGIGLRKKDGAVVNDASGPVKLLLVDGTDDGTFDARSFRLVSCTTVDGATHVFGADRRAAAELTMTSSSAFRLPLVDGKSFTISPDCKSAKDKRFDYEVMEPRQPSLLQFRVLGGRGGAVALGDAYVRVGNHVYSYLHRIDGADIASFQVFSIDGAAVPWARDKARVYAFGKPVAADVARFKVVLARATADRPDSSVGCDDQHVFIAGRPADSLSFTTMKKPASVVDLAPHRAALTAACATAMAAFP